MLPIAPDAPAIFPFLLLLISLAVVFVVFAYLAARGQGHEGNRARLRYKPGEWSARCQVWWLLCGQFLWRDLHHSVSVKVTHSLNSSRTSTIARGVSVRADDDDDMKAYYTVKVQYVRAEDADTIRLV